MKKYIILIPIYNDRESLTKLIENINKEVNIGNTEVSVVVINDASSQQIVDTYPNLENIHSLEIINMKQNRGHARCIASGLKYIYEKKKFDYETVRKNAEKFSKDIFETKFERFVNSKV